MFQFSTLFFGHMIYLMRRLKKKEKKKKENKKGIRTQINLYPKIKYRNETL